MGGQYLIQSVRKFSRLLALPRMGSLASSPKILNNDEQDNGLRLPLSINRNELLEFCRSQTSMHSFLLRREFRKCLKESENHDSQEHNVTEPKKLRILTWNVLSQALGLMNDNFARCPEEALDWNFRKYRIVEEIIQYVPDIICLQEVDHFNFLRYVLNTQGYSGTFFPKPDSPCLYLDGNNGPDGCAIFFKRDKFELVGVQNKVLDIWKVQSNQVALLVMLRIRKTDKEICVATTHMKARKGAVLSLVRNEQGKDLLQFAKRYSGNNPVILCGDFNAEPSEPVYNTMLFNDTMKLCSAYANSRLYEGDNEPPYTTWKIRDPEGEIRHTIDYIFYTPNNMRVETVLDFPLKEDIGEDRVPSFSYPSDHFSLVCDFLLKI